MEKERLILGVVGLPAAGKGTIAQHLVERYGAEKLRFSDALTAILERLGIERTRDRIIVLSEIIRERCGEDVLARAMAISVERSEAPLIVIDGVRREGDVALFRSVPGFHLIAVDADPKIRYERAKKRAEKPEEAAQSLEDFMALENRSTEVSTRELITQGKAETVIDNSGSFEELFGTIDTYLASRDINKKASKSL